MNRRSFVDRKRPILIVAALFAALIVAALRGLFSAADARDALRALSDGFLIVGFLLSAIALLERIAATGFFDIAAYAAHTLKQLFDPMQRRKKRVSFTEYRTLLAERRGTPGRTLLLTGLGGIAASVLLLGLWSIF